MKKPRKESDNTERGEKSKFELRVVRNATEIFFLKSFFFIIPSVYLFRALLEFIDLREFPHALLDWVKIPTEMVLIIALIFANSFFSELPNALLQLFSNRVLLIKSGESDKDFIQSLDKWLNADRRKVFGILAATMVFLYYVTRIGGLNDLINSTIFSLSYVDTLLYIFPSVIYAYFVGIVAWKLVITSWFLIKIPNIFNIMVQFEHPDGAGGLLPIGFIALNMSYVTFMPTLLSAFLLASPLINQYTKLNLPISNSVLLYGFAPLILLAGIAGSAVALTPIFKIHQEMMLQKPRAIEALNQISNQILELKSEIINTLKNKSADELFKRLRTFEELYKQRQEINTWPLNKNILTKIWGTQTLLFGQVLALLNLISQFKN
jgi:hypothetical protein